MDFFCIRRYGRAMSQRIYLINYERSLKGNDNKCEPFWKFTIMGNSESVYKLFFSPSKISCNCIDFKENLCKKSLCKHLFYVFGYVAKFTFQEIKQNDFPSMRRKLFRMFDDLFNDKKVHSSDGFDDCVICLQPLKTGCHQCDRCSQMIHLDCLRMWISQHNTCPICRHPTYISPTTIPALHTYVKSQSGRDDYSFFPEISS